jgi:hypothetical protein
MPLLSFFASNPDAVAQLTIEQVLASAGNGVLKDHSECSDELRTYLGQIPTDTIERYVNHCLDSSFAKGGIVLQDLINELGRRLDYEVENGRYQGVTNGIGFDGLWNSPEQHSLIIEVKTTDAYRISLETHITYRAKLAQAGKLGSTSSILIIVGREDTGELEAQIRGSRHAWDVRVISAEALIKLVRIKENSEAPETGLKIRSVLTPVEYTRLDRMVDVMFTAVTDVEEQISNDELPVEPTESGAASGGPASQAADHAGKGVWQFTDSGLLQAKREEIVASLANKEGSPLVRKSRALYWNATRDLRVACSISKLYTGKNQNPYWYAYHPAWDEFLAPAARGFFVLGCMDRDEAYAIPQPEMARIMPHLHTTMPKDGKVYWHIHLKDEANGLEIVIPKTGQSLPLAPFAIPVR